MHHHDDEPTRRGRPRVTPAQIVGIGLVAASLGWAAWLLRDRPISEEVELLPGTVLPSSELAIVEAAFDRAQLIGHRTEGGRVWVPRPRQSAYMRALVDAEALPREFGSSLRRALESNSPWQSRAVQEEMLRVAVQEELAHVICSMPGIERAAVLYAGNDRPGGGLAAAPRPTASVNVRTQAGAELEPARVQAIRVLVAASIAGLEAERVAVTDLRSGRVFAGPLAPDSAGDEVAQADPALARRIVHERHLAGKLRQGLAFVEGAIVDVTVTFQSPAAPRLPAPAPPPSSQRIADANAPAAIGDLTEDEHAVIDLPTESAAESSEGFPATILVSLAVPEPFFLATRGQAETPTDPDAVDRVTEQRLRDHVLGLLPPTTRADGRQVLVTRFPVGSTSAAASQPHPAGAVAAVSSPVRTHDAPRAGEAISLEAAWRAVLAGHPEDVPREVWLGVIAVAAGLLAWLVLRPTTTATRRPPMRRAGHRIDWSGVEDVPAEDAPATSASRRQVAA
jgi:type III secretory pathway lipoprotein EscJ